MEDFKSRIIVITGHYGSGKTELSINLAFAEKKGGSQVAIADLDVINPYFRSREVNQAFQQEGIEVIAPKGEIATADLPVVSGEIYHYISNENYRLIIDVGGDKDGALAAGQYAQLLKPSKPEVLFIVNTTRPYVNTVEGIGLTIAAIENNLRLKITGLVNNTNLGTETSLQDIEKGLEITERAAKQLAIPLCFNCATSYFIDKIEAKYPDHVWFLLNRYMKLPWE
ncbi:ParA family protein [Microaerobacter geothermalis]|uniref:ParA family protein n=1 Tax=Microaerobacter geothermalis TaxID=674972 RepID=UPI001F2821CA|nr:ParA family protein [Microaerobacter geothermalis]MCF6094421.1 ParA family protein [Microaerobacter geothermalis]